MLTSCNIFQGCKDKDGYGWQRALGERKAHRVAYIKSKGPIPEGMLVCHSCDNPSCVNPDHLFLGTSQDNVNDMMQKGRYKFVGHSQKGELNGNSKLTQEQVDTIRSRYKRGMGPSLSKEFGVGTFMINRIIRKEAWANETT